MTERNAPIPVYYQIECYIRQLIDGKQLAFGQQIPTERELTERFHVARMTVRQAMTNLVNEGVLVREKGRGTFVARHDEKLEKPLITVNGFSEDIQQRGLHPTSELIDFQMIKADQQMAERFDQQPGFPLFRIKRLRRADNEALAIDTSFIPCSVAPELSAQEMAHSLYEYLQTQANHTIDYAQQSFEAVLVPEEAAQLLKIPEKSPILLIRRLTVSTAGVRLEYTESLYRADRYTFTMTLPHR
ncbi:MAG: GntR family transcriptional regulator [Sporolactobacillus sp.]